MAGKQIKRKNINLQDIAGKLIEKCVKCVIINHNDGSLKRKSCEMGEMVNVHQCIWSTLYIDNIFHSFCYRTGGHRVQKLSLRR